MADNILVNLNDAQRSRIRYLFETRDYPAAYRAVLAALPLTGSEQLIQTRYWFQEAANINANNLSSEKGE